MPHRFGRRKDYMKLLGGKQWAQGRSNGGLLLDTATGAKTFVHGDDLMLLDDDNNKKSMRRQPITDQGLRGWHTYHWTALILRTQ
eukprot:3182224-Amphidinium_carterae.2